MHPAQGLALEEGGGVGPSDDRLQTYREGFGDRVGGIVIRIPGLGGPDRNCARSRECEGIRHHGGRTGDHGIDNRLAGVRIRGDGADREGWVAEGLICHGNQREGLIQSTDSQNAIRDVGGIIRHAVVRILQESHDGITARRRVAGHERLAGRGHGCERGRDAIPRHHPGDGSAEGRIRLTVSPGGIAGHDGQQGRIHGEGLLAAGGQVIGIARLGSRHGHRAGTVEVQHRPRVGGRTRDDGEVHRQSGGCGGGHGQRRGTISLVGDRGEQNRLRSRQHRQGNCGSVVDIIGTARKELH